MSNERPATGDILARVDQRRENLMRQHASSRRQSRQEISRMRVDAAEDRYGRHAGKTSSKSDVKTLRKRGLEIMDSPIIGEPTRKLGRFSFPVTLEIVREVLWVSMFGRLLPILDPA